MRAEHTAVAVHLIHHDETQIFEKLRPFRVMRQDRLVQHIGVADHDITTGTHRFARITRGISIEGAGTYAESAGLVELEQLGHLILGQRLGRKQVQRLPPSRTDRLQHRQVVTQGLARGRRRYHHKVPALSRQLPGLGLMRVELFDASRAEGAAQTHIQIIRQAVEAGRLRRQNHLCTNLFRIGLSQAPRQALYRIVGRWTVSGNGN